MYALNISFSNHWVRYDGRCWEWKISESVYDLVLTGSQWDKLGHALSITAKQWFFPNLSVTGLIRHHVTERSPRIASITSFLTVAFTGLSANPTFVRSWFPRLKFKNLSHTALKLWVDHSSYFSKIFEIRVHVLFGFIYLASKYSFRIMHGVVTIIFIERMMSLWMITPRRF